MSYQPGIGHNSGAFELEPPTGGEIERCRDAAERGAKVIDAFFGEGFDEILKPTRGSASQAFARQFLMHGLTIELGFSAITVGRAIGRDRATVEHACRVIEAFRGELDIDDLVEILGSDGIEEYLGGVFGAEEFLQHAEGLVDELGAALRLVCVKGSAYTREANKRKRFAAASAPAIEGAEPPAQPPLLERMEKAPE